MPGDLLQAAMRVLDDLFEALPKSTFRRRQRLTPADARYLRDKGLPVVMEHAKAFIEQRLAPAAPRNDGKQTPWRGHPAFVAQHATACCCRGCLAKWHGIPKGHELSEEEQLHVLAALERWLRESTASAAAGAATASTASAAPAGPAEDIEPDDSAQYRLVG